MHRLLPCLALLVACDGTRVPTENQTSPDAGMLAPDAGAVDDAGPPPPEGLPVLGNFTHDVDAVQMDVLGTPSDRLAVPRDLAFNPQVPGELWVINRMDESMVVFSDLGEPSQTSRRFWSPPGAHFLAQPSALAFGAPGVFATIHETDELTQGPDGTPPDFMGPTLWSSDLSEFDAGHGGHLDMLHNSPNGMGIAWERENVYWVFDGYHSSLTQYDFHGDHGLGGADHSDGVVSRYVEGEVARVENVPSHMVFDPGTQLLYVADTGNNRIAVLDTTTGKRDSYIQPNYDESRQWRMVDAVLDTLVDGQAVGLVRPSGLALAGDFLFVTDNATGTIYAFDLSGEVIDWLPTGLQDGALMGIEVDGEGRLYLVDAVEARMLRMSPLP